jgi:hypothetical protein
MRVKPAEFAKVITGDGHILLPLAGEQPIELSASTGKVLYHLIVRVFESNSIFLPKALSMYGAPLQILGVELLAVLLERASLTESIPKHSNVELQGRSHFFDILNHLLIFDIAFE